ncbi:hypothetical protein EDB83DRAFT_2312455 [Lactarius deliciosus]|nr:hypothetical protein EDB83DRAFT_2312455 [Lactarius deliciosus]
MPPTSNDVLTPPSENQCTQSKCKATLPVGYQYKTCEKCRSVSKLSMQKKWKRDKADEGHRHSPAVAPGNSDPIEYTYIESDTEPSKAYVPVQFKDKDAIMKKIKNIFKSTDRIFFHASCDLPADPLTSDRAQVQAIANEIWKATGYRFTVRDNLTLVHGHKTRHWCCQDERRKQVARPSQREGAKHRDTVGMHRYNCKSKLHISYRANPKSEENTRTITIWLEHYMRHTPYYDVALPPEAAALIREGLEWSCPNEITKRVQSTYLSVTANQVHAAWTTMSETLWKRGTQQLPSVRTLLEELKDDAALLDLPAMEGVEQVAWVMTKIMVSLRGTIVEIGMDATCKKHTKRQI